MATLALDLTVEFPAFTLALQQALPLHGITAVFGPSGCGKSTLLRAIAGLEPAARGRIAIDDEVWLGPPLRQPLPAHRRGVGLVFQDARLFGHLDVAGNLRFAERRGRGAGGPAIGWDDVVAAFDLAPLLGRGCAGLSGGERQRVAIARTLLSRPRLLLLDEPLAALDARRKGEILPYVEQLPAVFGVPVLYVTHDMDEVARLATRMWLLADGRLRASGRLEDVLEHADLALPGLEAGVVLSARVRGHDAGWRMLQIEVAGQLLSVPMAAGAAPAPGSLLRLRLRARDVALATQRPQGLSIRNVLEGTLVRLHGDAGGAHAEALVDLGGARIRALITRQAAADLGLHEGQPVFALVKSVALGSAAARGEV